MKDIKIIGLSFCSYENLMPKNFSLIFLFNITSFSCRSVRQRNKGEKNIRQYPEAILNLKAILQLPEK
jgi:hypothetical protein